jgi:hypothetical protein
MELYSLPWRLSYFNTSPRSFTLEFSMADLFHFLGISVTLSCQLGCSSLSANTLWIFFGVSACLTATHVACLLTLVASSLCPHVVDSTVSEFCWSCTVPHSHHDNGISMRIGPAEWVAVQDQGGPFHSPSSWTYSPRSCMTWRPGWPNRDQREGQALKSMVDSRLKV